MSERPDKDTSPFKESDDAISTFGEASQEYNFTSVFCLFVWFLLGKEEGICRTQQKSDLQWWNCLKFCRGSFLKSVGQTNYLWF